MTESIEIKVGDYIYRWVNGRNKHVFLTSYIPGVVPDQPVDCGRAVTLLSALQIIQSEIATEAARHTVSIGMPVVEYRRLEKLRDRGHTLRSILWAGVLAVEEKVATALKKGMK